MIKCKLREIRLTEYQEDNQKAFAKSLEIAPSQYNRYETGDILPSLSIALKIAKKLNKTVDEIWYDTEK
jgi:putative transcriptional regulator